MIPSRLRAPLAAAGASLILLLGFPESLGLWPLRLVAAWPGEIGRAAGSLLFAGHLGPLALSQADQLEMRGATPRERALATALGLVVQLAAGLALFWLAEKPRPSRLVLFGLAAGAGLAAIVPPVSAVTAAELAAALALALLGGWRNEGAPAGGSGNSSAGTRRLGVQFLAGAMVTAPLADLRPLFLSIGRPLGAVAILESQSGIPAVVWGVLIAAGTGLGLFALPRADAAKPAKVRPA